MASGLNVSERNSVHIKERQGLSGAYGKEVRLETLDIIEGKKEARKWLSSIQSWTDMLNACDLNESIRLSVQEGKITWPELGTTDRGLNLMIYRNLLSIVRSKEYAPTSHPYRALSWHVQEGRVSWEELKITEKELHILTAQKWVSDIKKGLHDVWDLYPQICIWNYIRDGKVSWENLDATKKDLDVYVARKWVSIIRSGDYDGSISIPESKLFMYIEKGVVTWEEIEEKDERELSLIIAHKFLLDAQKGMPDTNRYSPYKNLLEYIEKGRVTWDELKTTEKELNRSIVSELFSAILEEKTGRIDFLYRYLLEYIDKGMATWEDLPMTKEQMDLLIEKISPKDTDSKEVVREPEAAEVDG